MQFILRFRLHADGQHVAMRSVTIRPNFLLRTFTVTIADRKVVSPVDVGNGCMLTMDMPLTHTWVDHGVESQDLTTQR